MTIPGGKGHARRPEDNDAFVEAFERIFGKTKEVHARDAVAWTPETGYVFAQDAEKQKEDAPK